MSTENDQSTAATAGCAAVLCSLTIYPKRTNTMTLTQLKKRVDAAYEYAIDCLKVRLHPRHAATGKSRRRWGDAICA